ncbi:MAG: putative lyase [Actinoallomurus sp.]|jgi:threonine aldolase|nr:putative lyase [Actinoallomurus sp.]
MDGRGLVSGVAGREAFDEAPGDRGREQCRTMSDPQETRWSAVALICDDPPMSDNTRQRRLAAMRACDRILSGVRPATMRDRLADLDAGGDLDADPDFYGDGPVTTLENRVADLLGTEAAVFFPTGTMAQQVALRYGTDHTGHPTVALHPLGHQEMHERHAYAHVSGLRSAWPTTAPRNPTADEITALGEPVHTVVIELPLRDAGFVLPTWDELTAVSAAAHAIGARVHFDGARIWESAPYLGHSLSEIAGLADSTYVSFYKTLGGISGAALAGTTELASFARVWRHRYGGNVFQQWPAALTALAGLDRELPRIPDYVRHARTVAKTLTALPGVRVHPEPPPTHRFRLWLPHPSQALNDAALALAEEEQVWFAGGWQDTDVPGIAMTEITVAGPALQLTAADIIEVGERFLSRVAGR